MNKMEQVAKMLGVEIEEKFDLIYKNGVADKYNPYKFYKNGLYDCEGSYSSNALHRLLTGEWTIKKLPWKPKKGDYYYFIDCSEGELYINRLVLCSSQKHHMRIAQHNYFKTLESAKIASEGIVKTLKEANHE